MKKIAPRLTPDISITPSEPNPAPVPELPAPSRAEIESALVRGIREAFETVAVSHGGSVGATPLGPWSLPFGEERPAAVMFGGSSKARPKSQAEPQHPLIEFGSPAEEARRDLRERIAEKQKQLASVGSDDQAYEHLDHELDELKRRLLVWTD
jgi:DNA-binding transcriptional ArsR family regulator